MAIIGNILPNHVGRIHDFRAVLSHLFLSHVLWTSSSGFLGLLPQRSVKRQGNFYRDLKLSSGKIDPTIPLVVHGGQVSDLQA